MFGLIQAQKARDEKALAEGRDPNAEAEARRAEYMERMEATAKAKRAERAAERDMEQTMVKAIEDSAEAQALIKAGGRAWTCARKARVYFSDAQRLEKAGLVVLKRGGKDDRVLEYGDKDGDRVSKAKAQKALESVPEYFSVVD